MEEDKILVTNDYEKFKFIKGNRIIDKNNLKRLVASLKIHDAKTPILVNKDYYIIDGQHRFTARKMLNLPVYYLLSELPPNADSIIISTMAQKTLDINSIAKLRADNGNVEYQKLLDFISKYKLPLYLSIKLTWSKKPSADNILHGFKLGEYVADNLDEAETIANYILYIYDQTNSAIVKQVYFIDALLRVSKMKGFNADHFIEQITKYKHLISTRATRSQYQDMIHDIYNYKVRQKHLINLRPIKK